MAQLPKIAAAATAPASSPARSVAPARAALPGARVASVGNGPIDGAGTSTPTQLDTTPFGFQEQRTDVLDQNLTQGRQQGRQEHPGLINTPTQSFASLLEYDNSPIRQNQNGEQEPIRNFGGLVSKAVNIYETNAKVIRGENPVNGTEVSLTL